MKRKLSKDFEGGDELSQFDKGLKSRVAADFIDLNKLIKSADARCCCFCEEKNTRELEKNR